MFNFEDFWKTTILIILHKVASQVALFYTNGGQPSNNSTNTTTDTSIVLSAVSMGIAAISSFFICKQSKKIKNLEQQVNNGAVQLNEGGVGAYQSALINR